MRLLFLNMAIITGLCAGSCALADTHDGQVDITGTIRGGTCTVTTESASNNTVDMGVVGTGDFPAVGARSEPVEFTIELENCGADVSTVHVTFTGTQVIQATDLYALDDGGAQGLALEISDDRNTPIANEAPSRGYALTASVDNSLKFYAAYKSITAVSGGVANASISFQTTYD